jgi:hypothetical protein
MLCSFGYGTAGEILAEIDLAGNFARQSKEK